MNRPPACAACKHQRRKCREDCVLAPYFPSSKAREFGAVHRVFGFSNVVKMLSNLDHHGRKEAVESLEWEALMWNQDPVHGPLGAYKKACDIIKNLLMSQQTEIPNYETNNNWVLAVPNNVNGAAPPLVANNILQNPNSGYCEPGLVSHSYVNSFSESSSPWQQNYLPGLINVPDQQRQIRGFQLHRGLQGTEGNFENVNGQGHGGGLAQSGRARQAQHDLLAAAIPPDIMQ